MQPRKVNGLTEHQRTRICEGKHRWPDPLSATAGAVSAIGMHKRTTRLYIYQCPICHGWHLTRKVQLNQKPITKDYLCKQEQ